MDVKILDGASSPDQVKIKLSSAYHPETDGVSERTNKTIIQMLHYHIERNQNGWVKALPQVRFTIMNTVNVSTGYAPFQLLQGRHPRLIPPLFDTAVDHVGKDLPDEAKLASEIIGKIETDMLEAQDNLRLAKISQAQHVNHSRSAEPCLKEGDEVLLSTLNHQREYVQRGDKRAAKFMVCFNGLFKIKTAHPDTPSYMLDLPPSMHIFPTFHISMLRPYKHNNGSLFPDHEYPKPGLIVDKDSQEGWLVDCILDH